MLVCLLHMPYGFYTLVRFVALVVFGVMAVKFFSEEKIVLAVVSGALALLFQPLVKIALDRATWNVVDVIVAIGLVALFFYEHQIHDE